MSNRLTRNPNNKEEATIEGLLGEDAFEEENTEEELKEKQSLDPTSLDEATKKKSKEPNRATGKMVMKNGVVVMIPPGEEDGGEGEEEIEQVTEVTINKKANTVRIEASEEDQDAEVQHVIDNESERLSQQLAAQVKEENKKRADKARIETKPKKVGDVIVADSADIVDSSRQDMDLFEQLEKQEQEQEQEDEN